MGQYPCLEIHINRLRENARRALEFFRSNGVEPVAITKVFCAHPAVAHMLYEEGYTMLGDSRIENLRAMADIPLPKMLIRLPMISEAEDAVRWADCSLVSGEETLRALSRAAQSQNRMHQVVLMLELGDLREGCVGEDELLRLGRLTLDLPNLTLQGVGANLICYGGIMPSEENLGRLCAAHQRLERELGVKIPWVSGGNSSDETLIAQGRLPRGVNQLRSGALIQLGIGLKDRPMPDYHQDGYILRAEIIERNQKPSKPWGEIGTDAFGHVPHFEDRGILERAIAAVGRQDADLDCLRPLDKNVRILGGSSDHLLLELCGEAARYRVGDTVAFACEYASVLRCSTSGYVKKVVVED